MSIFFEITTRMGVSVLKFIYSIITIGLLIISILSYNAFNKQSERLTKAQLRIQVLEIMIKDKDKLINQLKQQKQQKEIVYVPQLIAGKEGTIAARLNNPLNVKRQWNGKPWKGQIGYDKNNHIHFKDLEYGIRAASHILKTYYYKHKINTVEGIITRYCGYNRKYINYVSKRLGVKPTQKINIIKYIPELLKAMTRYESGKELPEKVFVTLDLVKEL